MGLKFLVTFLLVAGWLVLETYSYLLIGRGIRRYTRRAGHILWMIWLPLGLLFLYFVIILSSTIFY